MRSFPSFAASMALLAGAAGCAHAQSSVTLYGLLDLGLEVANPGSGRVYRVQSGQWYGSRIGFKATEDLGSGYSVLGVLETGITADNGGGTSFGTNTSSAPGVFWDRQIFLGVEGPIGKIRFGRQYSLTDNIKGTVEPFSNGMAGDTSPLRVLNPSRSDNAIIYYSPSFGGAQFGALVSTGNELTDTATTSSRAGREVSVNATYANGPFFIGGAVDRWNTFDALTTNRRDVQKVRSWIIGSTYDFGPLKLHGWINGQKADAVGTGADTVLPRNAFAWALGISAPVTSVTKLYAAYGARNDKTALDRDAKKWGIGVSHDLSKRTTLYASYSAINNADRFDAAGNPNGAGISLGSGAAAGVPLPNRNADPTSLTMGVRHTF
jgi:general bacterial porin, GBP family